MTCPSPHGGGGQELRFTEDDLRGEAIVGLLTEHVTHLRRLGPPESTHALDLGALRSPQLTVWSVWIGPELVGCGALKDLGGNHGEVKSMRTVERWRGCGVGTALVHHLLQVAESRGWDRLSLETGSAEFFAPARRLYRRLGFVDCAAFGDYRPDPLSVFMTRSLSARAEQDH